jgi:hypothetical protein
MAGGGPRCGPENLAVMLFVMLLVTAEPALPAPATLELPRAAAYLTAAGCEAAAARVALPPALRLACVPVEGGATVLAAAH